VDWLAYGADKANSKYLALSQIHRANVQRLRLAWRWRSPDVEIVAKRPNLRPWLFEVTTVALNGVL
jgi:quinoprotein glucose dehydrogenase